MKIPLYPFLAMQFFIAAAGNQKASIATAWRGSSLRPGKYFHHEEPKSTKIILEYLRALRFFVVKSYSNCRLTGRNDNQGSQLNIAF